MTAIETITLKKYREYVNDKSLDKYEDLPVIVSCDDEGNAFDRILFKPSLMERVDIHNDLNRVFDKCICLN